MPRSAHITGKSKAEQHKQCQQATKGVLRRARKVGAAAMNINNITLAEAQRRVGEAQPHFPLSTEQETELAMSGDDGKVCIRCGRTGQRGFDVNSDGNPVCKSVNACNARITKAQLDD